MTVSDIRNILPILFRFAGKDQQLSIEEYNLLLQLSQYDVLKNQLGFPKDITGAETSQDKIDALRRYKVAQHDTLTAGSVALQSNYLRLLPDSCYNINGTTYTKINAVTEAEWVYYRTHPTLAPSSSYPICKISGSTLYVLPTTITTIDYVYIKKPTNPVYAVTIVNGIQEYSEGSSTQLDINEEYHIDIIRTILEYLSIPMTNENILGYLQQKKIEEK